MHKICKNCKFFSKSDDYKFYGECNNPKMEYESAYCYEKLKERKQEEIEKDKLFYMDYEWYDAGIEVGEEFGCIHYKAKEENQC